MQVYAIQDLDIWLELIIIFISSVKIQENLFLFRFSCE